MRQTWRLFMDIYSTTNKQKCIGCFHIYVIKCDSMYVSVWPQKWRTNILNLYESKKKNDEYYQPKMTTFLVSYSFACRVNWKTELIEWKPAGRSCKHINSPKCLYIIYHDCYALYVPHIHEEANVMNSS